jgi:hypothetical protein
MMPKSYVPTATAAAATYPAIPERKDQTKKCPGKIYLPRASIKPNN